jgi:hypothetical protein
MTYFIKYKLLYRLLLFGGLFMQKQRVGYMTSFKSKAPIVIVRQDKMLSQLVVSSMCITKRSPTSYTDQYDSKYHYDQFERVSATINILLLFFNFY